MSKKILVPIDESDRSTQALEFALEEFSEDELTVVHVINPDDVFMAEGRGSSVESYDNIRKRHEGDAEKLLDAARERAAEAGLELETEILDGDVAKAIIEYAGERDVDHIVLGSHGRTGARRILLGSVAEKIVRRSPVPVTVVR